MSGTRIKIVVFDFDGTLVHSNELKRDAYYEVFPKTQVNKVKIDRVLASSYEESRYDILDKILKESGAGNDSGDMAANIAELAQRYNDIVMNGAKVCPVRAGAEIVLNSLHESGCSLYLSSTTPEDALREIVKHRGWAKFFKGISGYPRRKEEMILDVLKSENAVPGALLVVGDGESDRVSAETTGVEFFPVSPAIDLSCLLDSVMSGSRR